MIHLFYQADWPTPTHIVSNPIDIAIQLVYDGYVWGYVYTGTGRMDNMIFRDWLIVINEYTIFLTIVVYLVLFSYVGG